MQTSTSNVSPAVRVFLLMAGIFFTGSISLLAQTVSPGVFFRSYLAVPSSSDDDTAVPTFDLVSPPTGFHGYDWDVIHLDSSNRLVWDTGAASIGHAMTLYSSALGEKVDAAYVSNQTRFADNWGYANGYAYATGPTIQLGQSVYFSYWRDDNQNGSTDFASFPSSVVGPGDQIGWAKVTRTATGFSLAASAMDYSGHGIVVGSFSSIPEPSIYAVLLGAVTLGFVAIRRRETATAV